jgi:hypothetical protein
VTEGAGRKEGRKSPTAKEVDRALAASLRSGRVHAYKDLEVVDRAECRLNVQTKLVGSSQESIYFLQEDQELQGVRENPIDLVSESEFLVPRSASVKHIH